MPELPEVEHLCRYLRLRTRGALVTRVDLYRADVVDRGGSEKGFQGRSLSSRLLAGGRICKILRLGKQFAIQVDDGRVLSMHLGMSGRVQIHDFSKDIELEPHTHCVWSLQRASGCFEMHFIDPRRFGGLWPMSSRQKLLTGRWGHLGPDALKISPNDLEAEFIRRSRPLKSALLDQSLVAGLGNIYVDESLFRAGLNPRQPVNTLQRSEIERLVEVFKGILKEAIKVGGSTIRTWVDSLGQEGRFTKTHQVYGRDGELCMNCGKNLSSALVAQRQTVWCTRCQPYRRRRKRR